MLLSEEIQLKCPYNCFSSHFWFLVIFVPLLLVFFVLFLVAVISISLRIFMLSSIRCIDESTLFKMLISPIPPFFLDTYSLSISSLECKTLCIVMSFFYDRLLRVNSTRRYVVPIQIYPKVSEEVLLGSTYTKTGKVLITAAAAAVLFVLPT